MITTLNPHRMYVVEVGECAYVGTVRILDNIVTVQDGFAGRPPVLALEDIDEITLVEHHPDVTIVTYDDEMIDDMDERISVLEESINNLHQQVEEQSTFLVGK